MIKILSKTETNPHADSSKSCNGGGYFQPEYDFEYIDHNGNVFEGAFTDSSCGDFGTRYAVSVKFPSFNDEEERFYACWGSMNNDPTTTFNKNMHKTFLKEFKKVFGHDLFEEFLFDWMFERKRDPINFEEIQKELLQKLSNKDDKIFAKGSLIMASSRDIDDKDQYKFENAKKNPTFTFYIKEDKKIYFDMKEIKVGEKFLSLEGVMLSKEGIDNKLKHNKILKNLILNEISNIQGYLDYYGVR